MTKFVFKKSQAIDPNVRIMDKRQGMLETTQESATVDYVFRKPGGFFSSGEHSLSLTIDDNYFTAGDLAEFINFLTAARERLVKQDAKLKS